MSNEGTLLAPYPGEDVNQSGKLRRTRLSFISSTITPEKGTGRQGAKRGANAAWRLGRLISCGGVGCGGV